MKFFTLIVLILATCLCITSCEDNTSSNTSYDFASDPVESYDSVSIFFPDGNSSSGEDIFSAEESQGVQSEVNGFVIKKKIYTLDKNNIVLISIANETNKNYTLGITGTYYDTSGNILETETQIFEDFVSQYQGYFVFNPGISFEKFTYTITYKDFIGEPRLSNITPLVFDLESAGYQVWKAMPGTDGCDDWHYNICTGYRYLNKNQAPMYVKSSVMAFDSAGKLLLYNVYGYDEVYANSIGGMDFTLYVSYTELTKDRSTWPNNLQGDIEIIVIPIDAIPSNEYQIGNPPH